MNLTTTLHAYNFDTRKPEEAEQYRALCEKLKAGPERHKTHDFGRSSHWLRDLDGVTVTLEAEHLFDNQWNTAPIAGDTIKTGRRVFDWAEDALFDHYGRENNHSKRGHYLDQTDAMREIRRNTNACGYCGKQEPAAKGSVFCPLCIGSEYLKATELRLLRMLPVEQHMPKRAELSEAEKAHLLPLYREAQLYGNTERDKKRLATTRQRIIDKAAKETHDAAIEREGFLWLLDRLGARAVDNCIFYSHTGRFCFGWRSPVDDEVRGELLDIISEFPFPYDIKCSDGKTLSDALAEGVAP